MIQRYINHAIICDLLLTVIIAFLIVKFQPEISAVIVVPNAKVLSSLNEQMIPIVTSILGFILTVVTVVITFKDGFIQTKNQRDKKGSANADKASIPTMTFLERTKSRKEKFYGTDMHRYLIVVLSHAAIEFGCLLVVLLISQLLFEAVPIYTIVTILVCSLFVLIISLARVVLMFYLFVNVHLDSI